MRRGMTSASSSTHHRPRVGGGSLCARFRGNAADRYQPPVTDPQNAVASACSGQTLSRAASSDADYEPRPTSRFPQIAIAASRPQAPPRGFLP
jgi:hypothetical protein